MDVESLKFELERVRKVAASKTEKEENLLQWNNELTNRIEELKHEVNVLQAQVRQGVLTAAQRASCAEG